MPNRFDFSSVRAGEYWADNVAAAVISVHPDTELYTCAAGISPSGIVHFGNFRDVITSYVVSSALQRAGKNTRTIFSWDNFDRLRKVPAGVDASFAEHIGKPLSKIPDPLGELSSYAERYQRPFVESMKELGIEIQYLDQTSLYESGAYDADIFHALKNRKEISDILLSFMTEKAKVAQELDEAKYREDFYPISVYSRFSGKDNTTVLSYDGGTTISYRCEDTDKEESVDLAHVHIAKLGWKPDWAMRWRKEGVSFEPGGHDHASPGGSYDAASKIAKEIFGYAAPVFAEYKFVGIQGLGEKMSGSKGNAISPKELLSIYDPILLKWLYLRKSPQQSFMLAFDTEIYRQYDEFDREVVKNRTGLDDAVSKSVMNDATGTLSADSLENAIPFRQAVGYGQIVQWNSQKLSQLLTATGLSYSSESIETRLNRANTWLTVYNPTERFELLAETNQAYAESLSDDTKASVRKLHESLSASATQTVKDLDLLTYDLPKREGLSESELKATQRAFFGHIYNLLIGKDTGPRLGTFLWAADREKVLKLLSI